MSCPVVSVIVPSYNHAQFLEQRLESILNQTFQDFELIILDDLSPDASRDIIEKYRQHPKVSQIIYNEKNSGSTFFQWNKAIFELAQGQFIWIAESDDVADIRLLETLVLPMQKNNNIVISYTQSNRMNSQDHITGTWFNHTNDLVGGDRFNQDFTMLGKDYINQYLVYKNTIPNASATVFRSDVYKQVGGADAKLKTNGDWDLWFKMLLVGDVFYTSQTLNNFRYHDSSVIARESKLTGRKFKHKQKLYEYDLLMRQSIENYIINLNQKHTPAFIMNHKIKLKDARLIKFFAFLDKVFSK
ncbi:glycosyltransferase [Acinetobacter boissieri]|uniref:Glycosyltransferase involved in cell wall bisynthesis n=1 Tax=Acinetobacter boissieri TaxID=1219383 RepID=A0A1G6HIJ2_9GAMM|nr:glycosyltransferase [Acinetobacter boissieri]SDB94070.1 Glycosyltransferase involved in cell wall bisynthesis [Acinetobacter boissieri]